MAKQVNKAKTISPENRTMQVHMGKGLTPPFHQLGEYIFQDLSADLFAEEPDVLQSTVYGQRGQTQLGVDIIANKKSGKKEVGQCKCYKNFTPGDIIKASDAFLDHWDTDWKSQNVSRFILFVACDVIKTQCIKEIERQKARFQQFGLEYSLWDAGYIERKLRPHYQIVSKYCHPSEHWIKEICGDSIANPHLSLQSDQTRIIVNTFISQLNEFASEKTEKTLQELYTSWQEGNEKVVLAGLNEIRNDAKTWNNTPPELKARTLCFYASISLEIGNETSTINELLDEANSYAQIVNEKRIRAQLLARNGQLDDAIQLIHDEKDINTSNFHAALLLNSQKYTEAAEKLSSLITNKLADAETYRLMAISALRRKDLHQAKEFILIAKEKEPKWFRIEFLEGMISYYQALSPIALPNGLPTFPQPVDWALIKQDTDGIACLRAAKDIFNRLDTQVQHIGSELHFAAWRLACLFCDTEHQEEAEAYCISLLSDNPAYYPAIIWATARQLDIDFQPSIELLEQKISTSDIELNSILALINLYDHAERFGDSLHLLETTRHRFKQQYAMNIWTSNYARLLISNNDRDEIERFKTTLLDDEEHLIARILIATYYAKHTGEWNEYIEQHLSLFQETREHDFLLDACMALYRNKRWEEFAQYAETLLEEIGTAHIYRHVISGVFYAHQYKRCLTFIEQWKQKFPVEKAQQEFRQTQISCLYALGDYEKALAEAKALVDNNPSVTNTISLIQLMYELGNYDGVATYADFLKGNDLDSETLLSLAQLLRGNHSSLAQFFWRKAVENDLPDEYLGTAVDLAFKLELDSETSELFSRLINHDKKEKQGFQTLQTTQEISEIFETSRRRIIEAENSYRAGSLYIHLYADALNLPLSEFFYDELKEKDGSKLLHARPLYIRYGGRPLMDGFPELPTNTRLIVDISALLLASHLGILDMVEQAFAPLHIPSEVFASLTSMVDRTYYHQPSIIEANKAILRLVQRKKLKVAPYPLLPENIDREFAELNPEWTAYFELAKSHDGYFLTALPPTKEGKLHFSEPVYLTAAKLKRLINCRTLADALRDNHILKKDEYKAVLHALGTLAEKYPEVPKPSQNAFILCDDSIVDNLAQTRLLEHACNTFDVYITQRKFEIAQGATSWDTDKAETRSQLLALQQRLRTGLQQKRYIALPTPQYDGDQEFKGVNATSHVLLALAKHSESFQETDIAWIDDRYSNHFTGFGKAPLITTVDILKFLVGKKLLLYEIYYEQLIQLRAANARYIPLLPEELFYHLENALEEKGGEYKIKQTHPLAVIKRSLAACIAHRSDIQLSPVPEQITHQYGEIEFILGLQRTIVYTLNKIWLSVANPYAREALADWIINNIYLDYPSLILREREQRSTNLPDYYRAGVHLTSFFLLADVQMSDAPDDIDLYQHYTEWVAARIIGHRFHIESELLEASVNVVTQTLINIRDENPNEYHDDIIGITTHKRLRSMPDILRLKIEADNNFRKKIYATAISIIIIDGLHFERNEFWEAVAAVVNGERKAIRAKNIDVLTRFYPLEEHGNLIVCIDHPQRDETINISKIEFDVLKSAIDQQQQFLKSQRHTFDCNDTKFQQIVDELLSIPSPTQRILNLLALWQESPAVLYRNLHTKLPPNKSLNILDLMNISFQSLQKYLRLFDRDNLLAEQSIEHGTTQLVQELGIEHTFVRLSGLPIPLPHALVVAIDAMPNSEREEMLQRWTNSFHSMPSRIHLLRLLYRYQTHTPALEEAADHLVEEICGETAQIEFEAFHGLLHWVHQQFLLRTEFARLSDQLKSIFTWTHTHHLFSMLKANNIDLSCIKDTFTNETRRMIPIEVLLQDKDYRYDITHPRFISYERFVLTGLSYATNRDINSLPLQIEKYIVKLAFPEVAPEIRFPSIFVLFNTEFLNNASGSFLSRSVGEEFAYLVEETQPEQFTGEALTRRIHEIINGAFDDDIETTEKNALWTILYLIIQDIPLPVELSNRLTDFFLSCDWLYLFTADYAVWERAFRLALLQYPSSKNESLKNTLYKVLSQITKICGEQTAISSTSNSTKNNEIINIVFEASVHLSIDCESGEVILENFSNILIEMSGQWVDLRNVMERVVHMLCTKLPLSYAQKFWSTLVVLRAM